MRFLSLSTSMAWTYKMTGCWNAAGCSMGERSRATSSALNIYRALLWRWRFWKTNTRRGMQLIHLALIPKFLCKTICHLPHFFVPLRHWWRIHISLMLTYDLVMHDQVIHSLLHPFAFMNFVFATNVHSPFMGTNCVYPPLMLYWSGKSLRSRSN